MSQAPSRKEACRRVLPPPPPGVPGPQVSPRAQQGLHGRRAAPHSAPVQRRLPRAVGGVDVASLVQQVGQHRHAVVQRRPLQREETLLVGAVQRLGICLRQLTELLKVAICRGLPNCAQGAWSGGEGRRRCRAVR